MCSVTLRGPPASARRPTVTSATALVRGDRSGQFVQPVGSLARQAGHSVAYVDSRPARVWSVVRQVGASDPGNLEGAPDRPDRDSPAFCLQK